MLDLAALPAAFGILPLAVGSAFPPFPFGAFDGLDFCALPTAFGILPLAVGSAFPPGAFDLLCICPFPAAFGILPLAAGSDPGIGVGLGALGTGLVTGLADFGILVIDGTGLVAGLADFWDFAI